jgi:hypothetical protein
MFVHMRDASAGGAVNNYFILSKICAIKRENSARRPQTEGNRLQGKQIEMIEL